MKRIFLFAFLLIISVPAFSQTAAKPFKIAALNIDSVLDLMPEMAVASDSMAAFQKRVEKKIYSMQVQIDRKGREYDSLNSKWSPLIRALKEKEISDMETELQNYKDQADGNYEAKRKELVDPIIAKVHKAAAEVAKQKGFAFVLDSSAGQGEVIYFDQTYNIYKDVCLKLGLK